MDLENVPKEILPFAASPVGCACFNVRRASRAITQLYEEALQPLGLKATQFSLLIAIGAGGDQGISALAELLVTDRTTLTRNLRHLIDGGYVAEIPSEDKRARPVRLTVKGRRVLAKAAPVWSELQARVDEALGAGGMHELKTLSEKVVKLAHPDYEVDTQKRFSELRNPGRHDQRYSNPRKQT